ncbi:MAG: DUF2141 domain-containing protein [Gammaproteobacteria bacterium]
MSITSTLESCAPASSIGGLFLAAALYLPMVGAQAAELTVNVGNVGSDAGLVRVALYDDPETFRDESRSIAVKTAPAAPGTVKIRFQDLSPGRYALIAYHDADANGKLNLFLGMIPREGYGLSNNPKISGPPSFDQTAFDLPDEGAELSILLKY